MHRHLREYHCAAQAHCGTCERGYSRREDVRRHQERNMRCKGVVDGPPPGFERSSTNDAFEIRLHPPALLPSRLESASTVPETTDRTTKAANAHSYEIPCTDHSESPKQTSHALPQQSPPQRFSSDTVLRRSSRLLASPYDLVDSSTQKNKHRERSRRRK